MGGECKKDKKYTGIREGIREGVFARGVSVAKDAEQVREWQSQLK